MSSITLSALHETKAAQLLVAIALAPKPYKNNDGQIFPLKIERVFGRWLDTPCGSHCFGEVVLNRRGGKKEKTTINQHLHLEIGRKNHIFIEEVDGDRLVLPTSWREGSKILIGRNAIPEQVERYAGRIAKRILKQSLCQSHWPTSYAEIES